MKKTGIYKITNPLNQVYIGQSVDIYRRWGEIKSRLGKNQKKLSNSLLKYGFSNHILEIICLCHKSELNYFEKYYIKFYDSVNNGLNISNGGESNFNYTKKSRDKIKSKLIGNKNAKNKRKNYLNGSNPLAKKIGILKDNKIIKKYNSILEASRDIGYSRSKISKILNNNYNKDKNTIDFVYIK